MKKRFIIIVGDATPAQLNAYQLGLVNAKKVNWWHWTTNSWLFITDNQSITASSVRDELRSYFPGVTTLVFEFHRNGSDTWAGFGPSAPDKNMFDWLNEHWHR